MLLLCSSVLLLAIAVFFGMRRSSLRLRIAMAAGALVVPVFAVSALVALVGDQAAPGSTIIRQAPR